MIDRKPVRRNRVRATNTEGVNIEPEGRIPDSPQPEVSSKVSLESISFNHGPDCDCFGAINIGMNLKKKVRIPEWKKGKESYPAAYLIDENIIIKAVFSASPEISSASIKAKTKSGQLGDCESKVVSFIKGKSKTVCFRVSKKTPNMITNFEQEWDWYCTDISNGTGSGEVKFGSSINKIYILLEEPISPPWETEGENIPWADVLDYACKWAEGATDQVTAASKITHALYEKTGGYYQKVSRYTPNLIENSNFDVERFIEGISSLSGVGAINCYDMAKALVVFANSLGCNVSYEMAKDIDGDYSKCIKPVGLSNYCLEPVNSNAKCFKSVGLSYYCCEYFENHAYGLLGDKVFDPTFILYKAGQEIWLTDMSYQNYLDNILFEGEAPSKLRERIPGSQKDVIFKFTVKQKIGLFFQGLYEKGFALYNFCLKRKKVLPGIKIDREYFKNIINNLKTYSYRESVRFENIGKKEFSVMHKIWYKNIGNLIDITIFVYPDYAKASNSPNNAEIETKYVAKEIKKRNITIKIKVGCDIKDKFLDIVAILESDLKAQPLVDRSNIKGIFNVILSAIALEIKKGDSVPICLEVKNGTDGELHCFWRTRNGYIGKNRKNDFFYSGEEAGKHCIKVIAINEAGLLASDELTIEVKDY